MKPQPNETSIIGNWVWQNSKMIADDNSKRIEELTRTYLVKVKTSADGWDVIYQDPEDLRFWELSYPHSEMHGGGPPALKLVNLTK
jgi:hypothetical protein